jgi:heptosyltransferase-1
VLTGLDPHTPLVCDVDLRGRLSLEQMLGLLSVAGRLVTMDSGALHMATSIGLPVMAVFGGVDPLRRVRRSQRVMALQSGRGCAPCNKNETCEGAYHCLQDISPVDVLQALERLDRTRGLEVLEIQEAR